MSFGDQKYLTFHNTGIHFEIITVLRYKNNRYNHFYFCVYKSHDYFDYRDLLNNNQKIRFRFNAIIVSLSGHFVNIKPTCI